MYFILMLFLAGQIAPLTLFPHWLQMVADILPFRWMLGFPVELLLGRLSPAQAVGGLVAQSAWVIISMLLIRLVWRAGVRIYSAVGA
jgi:ABC-2 type transport system permease protein